MKKLLYTTILLMYITTSQAQLNIGIKGGYNSSLNFSNISSITNGTYTLENVKSELNNGAHIGVFARLGKKVYIQPELLYAYQTKDYQVTYKDIVDPSQLTNINNHVTFSTIDIPVLLGYKLIDKKLFNVRAFAGPKFRLNAGTQSELNITQVIGNPSNIDLNTLKGEFDDSTIGVEAGAGIDLLKLTLDFKLNLMRDIYQADWQDKAPLNSNFIVSFGWKF